MGGRQVEHGCEHIGKEVKMLMTIKQEAALADESGVTERLQLSLNLDSQLGAVQSTEQAPFHHLAVEWRESISSAQKARDLGWSREWRGIDDCEMQAER